MNKNNSSLIKKRGRPFDSKKMDSIITSARRLFAESGFERTTIDAIAEMSGVSKMTIYSHFPSKEELFGATILSKVEDEFLADNKILDPNNPKDGLEIVARKFLALIRKDEVLNTYRAMFASNLTHADLCLLFYENGPLKAHNQVAAYLQKCSEAGSLKITDSDKAATQFLSLFLGLAHIKCLLGLGKPSRNEDEELILINLELFIKSKSPNPR
jgi:TetR/AcrR family transcriptional repressor of mexJK operon